jgi:tetratricopeptide (TPR) repeat protein
MNILQRITRRLAHIIGRVRLSLRARWIPPLGGFVLAILVVGAADYLFNTIPFPLFIQLNNNWHHKVGDWFNISTILATYILTGVIFWSIQARSRMVVENFNNYVGDEFKNAASGASMMLLIKLGQLHDLYQTVDEQRAIHTAALNQSMPLQGHTAVDAAINVDSIEAFLKDAVSTQSKLQVGPIEIPIGLLLSFIGHIARGPRITGSFHKDRNQDGKDLLILTAQATRNGQPFTWRVERELPGPSLPADLTDLIDEFACRIFTDMTLRSTVRWRAAGSFAKGLRAYRECLRTPKDRIANLRLAEEKFINALTEDTQYTLVHYNLGVVLTELQRKEAATVAFERAIQEDPRSCQAYYALALSCYQDEQYYRTTQLCKRVIDLNPDLASMAKAYQLRAMALVELYKLAKNALNEHAKAELDKLSRVELYKFTQKALYKLTQKALEKLSTAELDKPAEVALDNYKKALACFHKARTCAHRALLKAEINQQDDGTGSDVRVLQAENLLNVCIGSMAKIYLPDLLDPKKSSETTPKPPDNTKQQSPDTTQQSSDNTESIRDFLFPIIRRISDRQTRSANTQIFDKAGTLLQTALKLHSTDASYDALYHWQLSMIYRAKKDFVEAAQHSRVAVRAAPGCIQYLADLILNNAYVLATSSKSDTDITIDGHYEEFLFQTLLDLTFAEKNHITLPAVKTAHIAYTQPVRDGAAKYQEKHQRTSGIQAFLQLGCNLNITPERLLNMSSNQITQEEQECQNEYNDCIQGCYQLNGAQPAHCAKHDDHDCAECEHIPADSEQGIYKIEEINQTLCLSQMVLALGQIRLHRARQSGSDPLNELKSLQTFLITFEQKRSICTLLNDCDAQKQSDDQPRYEWERGRILSILASLYYEIGKYMLELQGTPDFTLFENAARYYHNAIVLLKDQSPQNQSPRSISAQNLRSARTLALLQLPVQQQEALKIAEETIFLDAVNYKNYETLGEVHFHCNNFSDAIEAWKEAVARKNTTIEEINDPNLYMKLGNAYVALAQSRHGICQDDQQCQEAVRYLEHALKCCTHEHVPERLKIYCSLGYLHHTRGDYDQAIKYLRLTQSFGFAPRTSTFYLGYTHLLKKEYDAALKQFRTLEEKTKDCKDTDACDKFLEPESGIPICLNEMKALALWGQAYTLMKRDIYSKEALSKAQCACNLTKGLAEKLQFPSRYMHCKGWILAKLEALEEPNEHADATTTPQEDAITVLRQAAELEAQPEIYLHLAQAYQHKLTNPSFASQKQQLVANIRAYCQHARDLNSDDDKSLTHQIDDLLKSLPA